MLGIGELMVPEKAEELTLSFWGLKMYLMGTEFALYDLIWHYNERA
jgi:hypothetical protein